MAMAEAASPYLAKLGARSLLFSQQTRGMNVQRPFGGNPGGQETQQRHSDHDSCQYQWIPRCRLIHDLRKQLASNHAQEQAGCGTRKQKKERTAERRAQELGGLRSQDHTDAKL